MANSSVGKTKLVVTDKEFFFGNLLNTVTYTLEREIYYISELKILAECSFSDKFISKKMYIPVEYPVSIQIISLV